MKKWISRTVIVLWLWAVHTSIFAEVAGYLIFEAEVWGESFNPIRALRRAESMAIYQGRIDIFRWGCWLSDGNVVSGPFEFFEDDTDDPPSHIVIARWECWWQRRPR